jgi:hypothetical protein
VDWLEHGRSASDDRPFLESEANGSAFTTALGALFLATPAVAAPAPAPEPSASKDASKNKDPKKDSSAPPEATDAPPGQADVAVAAAVVLTGLLLVLALAPRPRVADPRPFPRALELSLAPFGLALALAVFALVDAFIVSLGDPAYGWSLLVPMSLVGIGAGRLWLDVAGKHRVRELALPGLLVGAGWILLVALAAPPLLHVLVGNAVVALALSLPLMIVSGAILGAPLYATLQLVGARRGALASRSLALHQAGWALGGALAVWLAHEAGVRWVLLAGAAAFLIGTALVIPALKRV